MSGKTTVGVVPMLDISGSMLNAIAIVKINAKAFIQSALPGDQIGLVSFASNANRIYPNTNTLVTVTSGLTETGAAARTIDPLQASGLTNMGDAINIAKTMLATSTADGNAFVLLSDGWYNVGPNPNDILPTSPPIYIAALGNNAPERHFATMLAKNPLSTYYNQPNAYQMMQMFNDIRGVAPDIGVMANKRDLYQNGANFTITNSIVSSDSEIAQFNVVWNDPSLQYTSDHSPSPGKVNVVLIDPAGRTTRLRPQIVGAGYCIFNVNNCQPGTWKTLVQYDIRNNTTYGATAGFQLDTVVNMKVSAPNMVKRGEPIKFKAQVLDDGDPVENLKITSTITKPAISTKNALHKYSSELKHIVPHEKYLDSGMPEEIAKLNTYQDLQGSHHDLMPTQSLFHNLTEDKENGDYNGEILDTNQAGGYSVMVNVEGTNAKTGRSFSRAKMFGTLVTEH